MRTLNPRQAPLSDVHCTKMMYNKTKSHLWDLQWVWFWTLLSLCPPVRRTPWQPGWQSVFSGGMRLRFRWTQNIRLNVHMKNYLCGTYPLLFRPRLCDRREVARCHQHRPVGWINLLKKQLLALLHQRYYHMNPSLIHLILTSVNLFASHSSSSLWFSYREKRTLFFS